MPRWRHDDEDPIAKALEGVEEQLEAIEQRLDQPLHVVIDNPASRLAVSSFISIVGDPMQATQTFKDANGLITTAPTGNVEAWSSDNDAVATVDGSSGAITEVAAGTYNLSVANSGSFLPDGTTAFPSPASVSETVTPGPAVTSEITVA